MQVVVRSQNAFMWLLWVYSLKNTFYPRLVESVSRLVERRTPIHSKGPLQFVSLEISIESFMLSQTIGMYL